MLRILGEHAAHEVGQHRRQALVVGDRGEVAKFELAVQDRPVVEARHGDPAQSEGHQQDAQGVDVVGDAAVAAGGGVAQARV